MPEQTAENNASHGSVQFLNPEGLPKNPAYSNVVVVSNPAKTIYIGAQGAFDAATNTIIGKGDIAAQTTQVMKNIEIALAAAGATFDHVIKWNIYIAQGQPLQPGFAAAMRAWGNRSNVPINTGFFVSELIPADCLVCMDAIAVIPGE